MRKKLIFLIGGALGLLLFLGVYFFATYEIKQPSYGTTLIDKDGKIFYHVLNDKEEWHIKGEGKISPKLEIAVINYEDKNFRIHHGVDFKAIVRAFFNNITGRKRSGASTISMQLVKSLEPKKRTYFNKYKEICETFKLEFLLSKDEILRMYLNNSPYGGNIKGYETASRMYFRKSSKDLSWSQGAVLAVLPNAPGLINVEKNRKELKKKRDNLLKKLMENGYLSEDEYRFSIKEELPKKRYSPNSCAYHFSKKLCKKYPGENIKTTLNLKMQKKVEKIAKDYEKQIQTKNINDTAVLVVENKTSAIRAYYGSSTYWDMLDMERSPGSTLKPLLYDLAIEKGLILPQSKYPDVLTFFGNFVPGNADGNYRGMVTMEEALKNSYNIPFVYLLRDYNSDKFYYFLQDKLGKDDFENRAGLSLILGAKEFSPLDLGYFYTALANLGRGNKLLYLEKDLNDKENLNKKVEDNIIFEKGSTILTRKSMEKVVPPKEYQNFQKRNKIAWKTGTSFGRKDAWACGFNDELTVIVWVGNIDNRGNKDLRGDETAGRLFFRIFQNIISDKNEKEENIVDENIFRKIKIDEITGYRMIEDNDTSFEEVLAPKNATLLRKSPYFKKIYVDSKGKVIDSRSPEFVNRKKVYVLDYPEEVKKYYNSKKSYGSQLKILYPKQDLNIYLPKDLNGQMSLLVKIANPSKEEVYWYLNGEYLGHGCEDERNLTLNSGYYELLLVVSGGEVSRVSFYII